ncbi:MAG: dienelactone hydrolase family protein [Sporichthyaceae bacterium]
MTRIVLFHSVLGIRPGIFDAARRFTAAGHEVLVVDLFDGEVFDDYEQAMAFAEGEIGHPELIARAARATESVPDGFLVGAWSMGTAMATHVALTRKVAGALFYGGAVDPAHFDAGPWPAGVPAQIHCTTDDPWREQEEIDACAAAVRAAGGRTEVFDYPGTGHLFTDASLSREYDETAAELCWERSLEFCARFTE